MNINISPEDIDQYVKAAVLDSTLGKNIKEGIEHSLKELFNGYRNPVKEIMQKELERLVTEYIDSSEIKPKIMEAIALQVTPGTIGSIINLGVKRFVENM